MASRRVAQTRSARWMCGREGRRDSREGMSGCTGGGAVEIEAVAMGW
jgi:hypothetical protein